MLKLRKISFKTGLCKSAIFVYFLSLFFVPYKAEARIAFVDRNDLNIAEEITILIHSQIQSYIKYVLTSLEELESIKDIKNMAAEIKQLQALSDIKDEISTLLGTKDMLSDSIDEIMGSLPLEEAAFIKDLVEGGAAGAIDFTAIGTGEAKGKKLSGTGGTIAKIKEKKGAVEAANTAIDRSAQLMSGLNNDAAAKMSTVTAGNKKDAVEALVSANTFIYKSVPFADSVYSKYFSDLAVADAPSKVDSKIMRIHTASAAKGAPVGTIVEILDKYVDPKSPYSKEKIEEAFKKEAEGYLTKASEKGNGSAVEETTRQMGIVLRQKNMLIRQMAVIGEMQSDIVKLNAVGASMKACISGMSIEDTVGRYINAYAGGAEAKKSEEDKEQDGGKASELKD